MPFLASTISTYLQKSLLKTLALKPIPPPFLNELKWTEVYLQEMSKKVFTVTNGDSSLALKTMRQLNCQVDSLNDYADSKLSDVSAGRTQKFTKDGPSEQDPEVVADEVKAAEQLRLSRDQMQQILQLLTLERLGDVKSSVGKLAVTISGLQETPGSLP